MYTLKELKPLIIKWAKAKDLIKTENADKQRLKLIEECGELASAILKNDIDLQRDSIGDIWVVLTILEAQLNISLDWYVKKHNKEGNYDYIRGLILSPVNYAGHLFLLSEMLNHDLTECANLAWNEIKDRKGQTIGGTFIKDSDCTENHILGHA